MWVPIKSKYRKHRKGKLNSVKNLSVTSLLPRTGSVAVVACELAIVQSTQLEAARRVIVTNTRRFARVWPLIFPDIPRTSKPKEARMGHGKGSFSHWISRVSIGTVLYEFVGVPANAKKTLENAALDKFSMRARLVRKMKGL